ncbi:MAG: helicase [Calothrix sp. C42_A2020_038]|nr:helicase [Calothrix sp. C42_A2020_038]
MSSKIAEYLGRLFEVGFNIGTLSAINQYKIKHYFGSLYREELENLNFVKIRQRIAAEVVSTLDRDIVETWSTFFLQKGFLSGLNFFREYLSAVGWTQPYRLKRVEVVYYHCRFSGENSLGTYQTEDDQQWYGRVLSQLSLSPSVLPIYIDKYQKKGEFFNADTLVLLKYGKSYRILCLDLTVFGIRSVNDIQNIDYVEIIRNLLIKDINYLRSKSVFSRLRLDTESVNFEISPDLIHYFNAFKYRDKETAKLIQAGGYIYSFYQFLQEAKIIANVPMVFNAVGYSDRDINAISVTPQNLDILKTCYEIYKHHQTEDISSARLRVLNKIKRSAYVSFERGKEFVDAILSISPRQLNYISYTEKIANFFNSVARVPDDLMRQLGLTGTLNLRDAHAALIKKALLSQDTFIFLTGNPGIGKTTAIVDFLKNHLDEGFLFFYVSPRKQVNLDIIEKFKDKTLQLYDDRLFTINSHSNLIADNYGRCTVQYTTNRRQDNFSEQGVDFIDSKVDLQSKRTNRLKNQTDDTIRDVGRKSKGVLNCVCEAISTVIEHNVSNQIVATTSIQALKKTSGSEDTLKHFEKIFRHAYNEREGTIFSDRMQQISSRIKHFFVMIDEITGDDGGAEFLNRINEIISRYKLTNPEFGFNTKIIVADASIVDKNVITQHLSNSAPEPDKIYFRCSNQLESNQPISLEHFVFKNLPATIINTNSYPASSLVITYKLLIQSEKLNEQINIESRNDAENQLQIEILKDIQTLLRNPDIEQFIVYIQHKRKLSELIAKIQKHQDFDLYTDYLEIHASISEEEKQKIHQYQNEVKVIFMTSSGSRGLSFPKVKHILVEIPKYEIENNLMEIIQVIYRGRGNEVIDNQDKELTFYLGVNSHYYYEPDWQITLQESVLDILNILLLLKAAIMTRICGSGRIGRDNFIIIPIGGKSVFGAGETFSMQLANLILQLKQESHRNPGNKLIENVYTSLERLLSSADFVIQGATESNYLRLREDFNSKFLQTYNTLDKLLDNSIIESAYISGGMVIVALENQTLEENYLIKLADIHNIANDELWRNMQTISHSKSYPENLRAAIKDAIELIKKLRTGAEKTQHLELRASQPDQYYAFPLFAFICGDAMRAYFEQPEEPKDKSFREILARYIRSSYSVGNILPIGLDYQDFPFVVFRSYSLKETRQKIFTDKYLLSSHELNLLNLILSK